MVIYAKVDQRKYLDISGSDDSIIDFSYIRMYFSFSYFDVLIKLILSRAQR